MVGGLGDGSHGLHARKSRAALDQARAEKAETDNRCKLCLPGAPAKVPASALIVERSAPPHQVDEQPDGEHTPDHTEGQMRRSTASITRVVRTFSFCDR
jgi:hypothetical protein